MEFHLSCKRITKFLYTFKIKWFLLCKKRYVFLYIFGPRLYVINIIKFNNVILVFHEKSYIFNNLISSNFIDKNPQSEQNYIINSSNVNYYFQTQVYSLRTLIEAKRIRPISFGYFALSASSTIKNLFCFYMYIYSFGRIYICLSCFFISISLPHSYSLNEKFTEKKITLNEWEYGFAQLKSIRFYLVWTWKRMKTLVITQVFRFESRTIVFHGKW